MMWKFWLSRAEREKMDEQANIAAGRRIAKNLVGDLFRYARTEEETDLYVLFVKKIDCASDWIFEDIGRQVRR